MASFTSTLYTIGTALSRAQDADVAVDLLVAGQWVHGPGERPRRARRGAARRRRRARHHPHGQHRRGQVRQAAAFEGRPQVEAAPDGRGAADAEGQAHPMPAAAADRAV